MACTVKQSETGAWLVINSDGVVIRECATNTAAWRIADLLANEPVSAASVSSEFKEPRQRPSRDEQQEFYSGLIKIKQDRFYKDGWAWHQFREKFGFQPTDLHEIPATPSKSVWGWVNRKAIKKVRRVK